MRRSIVGITTAAVMALSHGSAVAQDTWLRTIGGSNDENSGSLCSTPDGGAGLVGWL